jgi:hypothetical protein
MWSDFRCVSFHGWYWALGVRMGVILYNELLWNGMVTKIDNFRCYLVRLFSYANEKMGARNQEVDIGSRK